MYTNARISSPSTLLPLKLDAAAAAVVVAVATIAASIDNSIGCIYIHLYFGGPFHPIQHAFSQLQQLIFN